MWLYILLVLEYLTVHKRDLLRESSDTINLQEGFYKMKFILKTDSAISFMFPFVYRKYHVAIKCEDHKLY